jgi:hypothetical protein
VNGELRWEHGRNGAVPVVYYRFTADDCEAIAACLPTSDGWADDLIEDAEQLRRLEVDDD